MKPRILIGAAVALCAAIALLCWPSGDIQSQLHSSASQALSAAGVPTDVLSFEGREATLTGPESALPVLERARDIVAAIPGVASARIVTMPAVSAPGVAAKPAEPAPAPAAPQAQTVPLQRGLGEVLSGRIIEFETGGTVLDANSRVLLVEVAELLNRYPDARIGVVGHTDSRGNERANLALSQARAQAVARQLADLGVSPARLRPMGRGETRPIAGNDTPAGRRSNRRVEIIVEQGR